MSLADAYDAFLLDLDGVVWRGDVAIRGAQETIAELRERGKRIVFVTNNSSRTPREYAIKLMRMKIPTQNADIVTSGHTVVRELRRMGLGEGSRVHVCGGEGLTRLLTFERFVPTEDTRDVEALVVGYRPRATFEDVRRAADLAREGVPFIASNDDPTYPAQDGLLPGTGSLVAAIETAAGRKATVTGKPRPALIRLALERAEVDAERALFIGDRAETDIVGAKAAGVPCALVLTGITKESELASVPEVPDLILDDLGGLLDDLPPIRLGVREGAVVVTDAGGSDAEIASLDGRTDGRTVHIEGVRIAKGTDKRIGWYALRTLLVRSVAGAEAVEGPQNLRPYLERIGAPIGAPEMRDPLLTDEPEEPSDRSEAGATSERPQAPEPEGGSPPEEPESPSGSDRAPPAGRAEEAPPAGRPEEAPPAGRPEEAPPAGAPEPVSEPEAPAASDAAGEDAEATSGPEGGDEPPRKKRRRRRRKKRPAAEGDASPAGEEEPSDGVDQEGAGRDEDPQQQLFTS